MIINNVELIPLLGQHDRVLQRYLAPQHHVISGRFVLIHFEINGWKILPLTYRRLRLLLSMQLYFMIQAWQLDNLRLIYLPFFVWADQTALWVPGLQALVLVIGLGQVILH